MDKLNLATDIIKHQVLKGIFDIDVALHNYYCQITNSDLTDEEKAIVKTRVKDDIELEKLKNSTYESIEDPTVISNPESHDEWYTEWLENEETNSRYYWDRLENYLYNKLMKKFDQHKVSNIVASIDKASDMILHELENPSKPRFHSKGLVIGHVQSGKTANFTAVIAKAADAGYKLIVVLAGLHNNLRAQTQLRLETELTGTPFKSIDDHIDPPKQSRQWYKLTGKGDFIKEQPNDLSSLNNYTSPILLVIKKRPEILNKLNEWLKGASEETRMKIPALVIDDEADLASIDTSTDQSGTPTNQAIRDLLYMFNRHSYIGYTATPFANMLIDKKVYNRVHGRDLYPRNFILSLPQPEGYVGAEKIFSSGLDKYLVKIIPKDEVGLFSGERHKTGALTMTPKLKEAFCSFVLAASSRYSRGHSTEPMTMLVHTTHLQYGHEALFEILSKYKKEFTKKWSEQNSEFIEVLKEIWSKDFIPATRAFDFIEESFKDISLYVSRFLNDLKIYKLNSDSYDELDYTEVPDLKVIAIGGNTLSRGLTLEGLMTSFFLRNTHTYDSLLQMGRWFGYREGYEDLTRVYTSQTLANYFEDLALVEEQVREDLLKYAEDKTPEEISPLIRAHKNMKITAPNKMGAGVKVWTSYSEKSTQTTWLPLDNPRVLKNNLSLAKAFVNDLISLKSPENDKLLFTKIPYNKVLDFISSFDYDDLPGFDHEKVIQYIERVANEYGRKELQQWNIGVPTRATPYHKDIEKVIINDEVEIIPANRSKTVKHNNKIGSLTTEGDFNIDGQDEDREDPLLLIYFVSKNSRPKKTSNKLIPLFNNGDEKVDVVGIAIDFPKSLNAPNDEFEDLSEDYVSQPD